MHTHPAGDMSQHFMTVLEFHPKHRVRERLDDSSFHFDDVLLSHLVNSLHFPNRDSIDPRKDFRTVIRNRDSVFKMYG